MYTGTKLLAHILHEIRCIFRHRHEEGGGKIDDMYANSGSVLFRSFGSGHRDSDSTYYQPGALLRPDDRCLLHRLGARIMDASGILYGQHLLAFPLMIPPNNRAVTRKRHGLGCLELYKRSKSRDPLRGRPCCQWEQVLCSGRPHMTEFSTVSTFSRRRQENLKTVKGPGRQRLPRQGIRHRSPWLPNKTHPSSCCIRW